MKKLILILCLILISCGDVTGPDISGTYSGLYSFKEPAFDWQIYFLDALVEQSGDSISGTFVLSNGLVYKIDGVIKDSNLSFTATRATCASDVTVLSGLYEDNGIEFWGTGMASGCADKNYASYGVAGYMER